MGDNMDSSAMYNPHIVARQLGYDQDAPFPLVHGFDSKGIKVWVPGICRRGIASKEYVAWLNDEFVTHQEADRYVRPVDEIGTGSSPLDADTTAGKSGECTMQDNRKHTREEQQLAQEVKTELIVLDRSPCYMDSNATAVKRKNGNRKRRDEPSENGDMHKKIINLDDDQENEDGQLALELQEFMRCGLFSQWKESFDEDEDEGGEGKKEMPKKSNIDPYAEAVMSEYRLFFELIPQRPHYKGPPTYV
ncbi:putative mitochondrial protein [Hordeum vulgare]|nr:putative mitochondrial protein [Hordeum vulgare]